MSEQLEFLAPTIYTTTQEWFSTSEVLPNEGEAVWLYMIQNSKCMGYHVEPWIAHVRFEDGRFVIINTGEDILTMGRTKWDRDRNKIVGWSRPVLPEDLYPRPFLRGTAVPSFDQCPDIAHAKRIVSKPGAVAKAYR